MRTYPINHNTKLYWHLGMLMLTSLGWIFIFCMFGIAVYLKYFLLIFIAIHLIIIILFNNDIIVSQNAISIRNTILSHKSIYLLNDIKEIRLSFEKSEKSSLMYSVLTIVISLFYFYQPKYIYLYLNNGSVIKKGCWSFEYDWYDNDNATRMDYLFYDLSKIHSNVKWTKNDDSYFQPS